MAILLSCTSMVFYQWGVTRCELKERQEAIMQMNAPNKSMVTTEGNSTIKAKVQETFQDDDEDKEKDDEAIANNKDYKGFDTGIHRETTGKEQEQDQDQQDFTFDDPDDSNDSDDKEKKDTDDVDKSNEKIVISFWPK